MHAKTTRSDLYMLEYISKRCIEDIKQNIELLDHIPIELCDGNFEAQVTNWNAAKRWFATSILETMRLEDTDPESYLDEKTVMKLECYI